MSSRHHNLEPHGKVARDNIYGPTPSLLPVFSCLTISDTWTNYISVLIKYKNVGSRLKGLDHIWYSQANIMEVQVKLGCDSASIRACRIYGEWGFMGIKFHP